MRPLRPDFSLNLASGRLFPADALLPLAGKRIALCIRDARLRLTLILGCRGFAPAGASGAGADVTISANLRGLLALARREEDSDSLFFSRRLLLEGDTELGLLVKNTLDGIDFPVLKRRRA